MTKQSQREILEGIIAKTLEEETNKQKNPWFLLGGEELLADAILSAGFVHKNSGGR